jgi:aminoglycoside phosphotransferase (APT) family kinase protein
MSADIWENVGTTPIRQGFAIDAGALQAWMTANVAGFTGPLSIAQFKGGQSNPTYMLKTPLHDYVLRRKPPGQLLKGAHAIEREAKVISALGSVEFPVPHIHGLCVDESVLGTWFYVMDMVHGRIFWDTTFPEVGRDDRPHYFEAMNTTLAKLHSVDFNGVGLGDYGRSGNYFSRQIGRWTKQYLEDSDAGRDPNMDKLIEWLPGAIPDEGDVTALVHGDFRCDNMIFHPTEPRVLAVLDWELSTLGHPGADFAYHAMMYRMPPHIVAGLRGADLAALNIPSEQDYLDSYCGRAGRKTMPHYQFYLAFNFFRMAAIFHGIKGRCIRGTAASAQARDRAAVFPELAQIAWEQAEPNPLQRPSHA